MFAFSAALLIYAGLLALTKDYRMLPLRIRPSIKPKNRKQYVTGLAKVIALVAVAPALSGATGFLSIPVAVFVLISGIIAAILLGSGIVRKQ